MHVRFNIFLFFFLQNPFSRANVNTLTIQVSYSSMKNYTLALISLLIFIGSNVKAEDASVLAKQEAQMQVLAELERLAKQGNRLAAAQKSIFLVIKRER